MEVDRIDAAVRTEVEAMMVLTEKPEVSQTDAALLVEELAEIYSTPTPMGLPEPKKVNNLYLINCVCIYNDRRFIFIPRADKSPEGTCLTRYI